MKSAVFALIRGQCAAEGNVCLVLKSSPWVQSLCGFFCFGRNYAKQMPSKKYDFPGPSSKPNMWLKLLSAAIPLFPLQHTGNNMSWSLRLKFKAIEFPLYATSNTVCCSTTSVDHINHRSTYSQLYFPDSFRYSPDYKRGRGGSVCLSPLTRHSLDRFLSSPTISSAPINTLSLHLCASLLRVSAQCHKVH